MTSNLVFSDVTAPVFKVYAASEGFEQSKFAEVKNCRVEELVLKTNDINTARISFIINRGTIAVKGTDEIMQAEDQFEFVPDTAVMITRMTDSTTENIVFAGIVNNITYDVVQYYISVNNTYSPKCFVGHAECIGVESFLQEIKLFSYFCYDLYMEGVIEVSEKTLFANNYNSMTNSFGGSEPWTVEKLLNYLNYYYRYIYKGTILAETSLLNIELQNLQADNIYDLLRELLSYGILFRTTYLFNNYNVLTFQLTLINVFDRNAYNYNFPCSLSVTKSTRYNGIVISWNSPFHSSEITRLNLMLTAPWQSDGTMLANYKYQLAHHGTQILTFKNLYTKEKINALVELVTPKQGDMLSQQNTYVPDYYLRDYPIAFPVQELNIYGGSFIINLSDFKFEIASVILPLKIYRTTYNTIPVTFVNNAKTPIAWWVPETEISIKNGIFRIESEIRHAFVPLNLAAGPGYFNSTFCQPQFYIDLSIPVVIDARLYSENASFKFKKAWLESLTFNKTLFVDLGNLPAFPPPDLCNFYSDVLATFFSGSRNSAVVSSIDDTVLNQVWENICVDKVNEVELNTFAHSYSCRFDEAADTYVFSLNLDIFDEQFFITAIKKRMAMNNLESYVDFSEQPLRIQSSMNDSFVATVSGQSDDFFNTCTMTDLNIPIYSYVLKPTALQTTEYLNNTNRQYARINSYTRKDLSANETQIIVPNYSLDNFIRVKINDEDLCYDSNAGRWHTLIDENEQNARAWARKNVQ